MSKVEVKRIVIKVGDKEIPLTLEEAKELKGILSDLFGEGRITIIPSPYPIYIETKKWVQPYDPYRTYPWVSWQTAYTNATGTLNITSNITSTSS